MSDIDIFTPYSNITPMIVEEETWAPEAERERIASYAVYDQLYWSFRHALKLALGDDRDPIYIPTPRTIVDSTAHFLLKGLQIVPKTKGDATPIALALDDLFKRERFLSRFHANKLAGTRRGDWVFHMTADPTKPAGKRVSITPIDPGSYFPIWNDDDITKLEGMDIVDMWIGEDGLPKVHRLRYRYEYYPGGKRVLVSEGVYEVEGWWKGKAAKVVQILQNEYALPNSLDTIPVFHFLNIEEADNPFGSSELRGFEGLIQAINQGMTDEDMALALEGLGAYATDAAPPQDNQGNDLPWMIAPGQVLEVPGSQYFKRIEGVGSVQPMQDHYKTLTDALYEASGTFRPSQVDVLTAESGVAMAIKFMPTMAKIEMRDQLGLDILEQFFYNWRRWVTEFDKVVLTGTESDLDISIGEKLPESRKEKLNELNNMKDRDVISAAYYRDEMAKLGYTFPDHEEMQKQIFEEKKMALELQQMLGNNNPAAQPGGDPKKDTIPGNDNQSNNAGKPNESAGTEAG